ncbi:MAG: hypothetical protein L0Y55_18775, partial [Anaerolineales bacterium]|nr:hypothetical protein [Anaerolineales bacterium]
RRVLHAARPLYVAVQQGEDERWIEARGARFFAYYQPDELAAIVRLAGFDIQESWVNRDEGRPGINWINLIALAK